MVDKSDFVVRFLKRFSKVLTEKLPKEATLNEMYEQAYRLILTEAWLRK